MFIVIDLCLRSALLIVVTNTNTVAFDFCDLGFDGVANRLFMPLHTVTIEISKEWTSSQAAFTHPYAWLNLAAKNSAYSEIALLGKRIMFFSLTLGSNKIAVKHNKHTARKHNSKKRTNFIVSPKPRWKNPVLNFPDHRRTLSCVVCHVPVIRCHVTFTLESNTATGSIDFSMNKSPVHWHVPVAVISQNLEDLLRLGFSDQFGVEKLNWPRD